MSLKEFCKHCGNEEKDHDIYRDGTIMRNRCPGSNGIYFELYEGIIELTFEYPRDTLCLHCGRKEGNHRARDKSCPAGDFRDFSEKFWSHLGTSFEPFENININSLINFCKHCSSHRKYHFSMITRNIRSLCCPASRMFPNPCGKEESEAYWNERGTVFEKRDVPSLDFYCNDICQNCNKSYGKHYVGDNRCPDIMIVTKRDGNTLLTRKPRDTYFSQEESLSVSKENISVVKNDIVVPKAGIDALVHMQYHWNQEEILKQWGIHYKGNDIWVAPINGDISLNKIDTDTWLLRLGFTHVYRVWTKG